MKIRVLKVIVIIILALLFILLSAFSIYWVRNTKLYDWNLNKCIKAGFVEKDAVTSEGNTIHYAEGPDNGPALLLIHGQCADWTSYSACLPQLSRKYHIYAVDCYGHGKSSHDKTLYSANKLGEDISSFISDVIKQKTIVSGHSSGGLIAAWIAANSPEKVSGIVMEDPPYFSCEDGRKEKSWNYNDTSTVCDEFLKQSDTDDFTMYYFENMLTWKFMPEKARENLVSYAKKYRQNHRNQRFVIGFLPPSMMGVFDCLDNYDPEFGETFYDGTFNKDFNHADTLSKIKCPAVLIHASHKISDDGMLEGAMTDEDAKNVLKLVPGCIYSHSDCIHCVHSLDTKNFINIVDEFVQSNNL